MPPIQKHFSTDYPSAAGGFGNQLDSKRAIDARKQAYLGNYPFSGLEKELCKWVGFFNREELEFLRSIFQEACANRRLVDGQFKVSARPATGAAFDAVPPLSIADLLRAEVISRRDGTLVVYGVKSSESILAKQIMESGGEPAFRPTYVPHGDAISSAQELREHLQGRVDLGEEEKKQRLADLDELIGILSESRKVSKSYYDPDASKEDRNAAKLILKIEKCMARLEEARGKEAKSLAEYDFKPEYSSSKDWPVKPETAEYLAHIIAKSNGTAQQEFSEFLRKYADALRFNVGVETLQFSQSQQMLLLTRAFKLSMLKAIERGAGEQQLNSMELAQRELAADLHEIFSTLAKIDRVLDHLTSIPIVPKGNASTFREICRIGDQRRVLFHRLESAMNKVRVAAFGDYAGLSALIVASMAHNLVRTTNREAELWGEFLSHHGSFLEEKLLGFSSISARIMEFSSSVAADAKRASAKPSGKRNIKLEASQLEEEILEGIQSLAKHSMAASLVLRSAFASSKSHMFYKFGGTRCMAGSMEYYFTDERFLLSKGANWPKLGEAVGRSSRLFALMDKYGLAEEVLSFMDRFNHFEPNAIDSEPKLGELIAGKSTTRKIDVDYRKDVDVSGQGNGGPLRRKITASSDNPKFSRTFELPKHSSMAGNAQPQKSFEEVLFGRKEPLEDFLLTLDPDYDGAPSAAKAYSIVASSYVGQRGNFLDLREKMNDRNSDEYLLSFRQRQINGLFFISRDGKAYEIEPSVVGAKNEIAEMLVQRKVQERLGAAQAEGSLDESAAQKIESEVRAEIEQKQKDVQWYFYQLIARSIFNNVSYEKWRFALQCAERIAKH